MGGIVLNESQRKTIQKLELEILVEIDRICTKHNIEYTLAYGTLIGAIRHKGFIPWDDDIDISMTRKNLERFKVICRNELNEKFFYQSNDTDPEYFHLFDKIRLNNTVFKETFLSDYNIHHGVYVDLFAVDEIPDSSLKFNFQYYKFHFFRSGLMAKYLNLSARHGKKKVIFGILRLLYTPFSLQYLYRGAMKTVSMYNECGGNRMINFMSSSHRREIFNKKVYSDYTRTEFEGHSFMITKHYDFLLNQIYGNYMKLPPIDKRTTRHDLTDLQI